jgi:hypothetical protein
VNVAWLPLIAAESVTPVGAAAGNIVSYILGYGVLGVVALAFAFRYIVPRGSVDAARADLIAELDRVRAEKIHAEEQRDEALRIAQVQLVPLLSSFTTTTSALLPLLQEVIRHREHDREEHGDPRPGRH